MTVSCVYVYTHASSASRPPTGRTIHTSPSLALTNGSAFGELLLLIITNEGTIPSKVRTYVRTNEGTLLLGTKVLFNNIMIILLFTLDSFVYLFVPSFVRRLPFTKVHTKVFWISGRCGHPGDNNNIIIIIIILQRPNRS